jgi:hypothetical protein
VAATVGCALRAVIIASGPSPRFVSHRERQEAALSRRALGPIALIAALLLLVGAAVVFLVLAVDLVRDMADGTGELAEEVEEVEADRVTEDAARRRAAGRRREPAARRWVGPGASVSPAVSPRATSRPPRRRPTAAAARAG